jgi:hypothetical protein
MQYYRQLVASSMEKDVIMIGVEGIIVEIYESKFGKTIR